MYCRPVPRSALQKRRQLRPPWPPQVSQPTQQICHVAFSWHVTMPIIILVQDLDHGHANNYCCNRHLSGYRTRIIGCCFHTAHQGCSRAGVPRATRVLAVSRRRHQRPAQHRRRHTVRRHQSRQHQTRRPRVRQQLVRRIPS